MAVIQGITIEVPDRAATCETVPVEAADEAAERATRQSEHWQQYS